MGVYNGMHYMVHFRSGELWHFYSVKNKGIFFRRFGLHGKWEEPVDLFLNTQEDFSVRIDSLDHLHLLCRSVKGEILYMHYNGRVWSRQVLSSFDPVRYVIRYPVILPIKDKIHVIFAIGTAFSTGYWSLYHYVWNGTKWHSAEITRITAGYRLSPFCIDLSDKYIHLVYRGLSSSKFQIFYCRYHTEHGIWSTPENVTLSTADCSTPSILIRDDRLHLIWTSLTKNDLTVKYKSKAIRTLNKVEWTPEINLSRPGSSASFPSLAWAEEKLWCIWSQADTLYGCFSGDGGTVWSEPEGIKSSDSSFYRIHYSTNHMQDHDAFQLQWILGNASDTLFLPVINDHIMQPGSASGPEPAAGEPETELKAGPKAESISDFQPMSKQFRVPGKDIQNKPSLENTFLTQLDKQEEHNDRILRKLEEQASLDHAVLTEIHEVIALLKENTEKLQTLLRDMEQIKNDIQLLQSKGLLGRLFK